MEARTNDEDNEDQASAQEADFFDNLKKLLKVYIDQKAELAKLTLIEKTALVGGLLFSVLLIAIFSLLLILFLSVMAGLLLAECYGNYYIGFAWVAGFYLVVTLALIVFKKKIEMKVTDLIVRMTYKHIK